MTAISLCSQQMVGELPAWMRLWCVMRQNTLRCWQYPEDVGWKMPTHSFSFTEVHMHLYNIRSSKIVL